ncbi:MAG TPA: pilus assembly protein TadG-related protein [Streptosporangiaceae bacterium]|nr:pilus assembly protein TadG-related protein [Streptosporangiaceae bacterium]
MSRSRSQGRMLPRRLVGPKPAEAERGSLTLMLAAMFVMLLALVGLVVDGSAKLAAAQNATSIAQEAARAGAGMVSQQTAYASGNFVVDVSQAKAAATRYLAIAGYDGKVSTGAQPNTIQVVVTVTEPTKILSLIGIDTIHATGTATAQLFSGVTGPGQ